MKLKFIEKYAPNKYPLKELKETRIKVQKKGN